MLTSRTRETYNRVIIISRAGHCGNGPDLQQKTMSTKENPLPMKVEFQRMVFKYVELNMSEGIQLELSKGFER